MMSMITENKIKFISKEKHKLKRQQKEEASLL